MKPGRYTVRPTFLSDSKRTKELTREVRVIEERAEGFFLVEEVVKDGQAGKLWSRGDQKVLSTDQWDFTPA